MGYGLLQAGLENQQEAMNGMGTLAQLDKQRKATNDAIKQQKKATTVSNVGTGASMGMMYGMQAGGGASESWSLGVDLRRCRILLRHEKPPRTPAAPQEACMA